MKNLSRRNKTILFHVCVGLVVIAVILFCRNFRYYSAETVDKIFDEYGLYTSSLDGNTTEAIITPLHSSDFKKCEPGMTRAEMIDRFGQPHALYGSGIIRDIYLTTDGCYVSVYCQDETVNRVGAIKMLYDS